MTLKWMKTGIFLLNKSFNIFSQNTTSLQTENLIKTWNIVYKITLIQYNSISKMSAMLNWVWEAGCVAWLVVASEQFLLDPPRPSSGSQPVSNAAFILDVCNLYPVHPVSKKSALITLFKKCFANAWCCAAYLRSLWGLLSFITPPPLTCGLWAPAGSIQPGSPQQRSHYRQSPTCAALCCAELSRGRTRHFCPL